jgi:muconolactone delta-isomerase
MEFLVSMTTHVPDGVTGEEIAAVRSREAENTRALARAGRVSRLWRPPLAPGEWRTIGLFVARDEQELDQTLAAMPLRIWRADEVTPLRPHANDPGAGRVPLAPEGAEFLTTFSVTVPPDAEPELVEALTSAEARRTRELAAEGWLLRLWALPGADRNLGHWQARDDGALGGMLQTLPMIGWLTVDTVPVGHHPSDPGANAAAAAPRSEQA